MHKPAANSRVPAHHNRDAYSISVIGGIDQNVVDVHWYQKPGGSPVPMANDSIPDALKAILLRRQRFYVCDVWIDWHPTTGPEVAEQLQRFADSLSDNIKSGG